MTRLTNLVIDTNPVGDFSALSAAISHGAFRAGGEPPHIALSTAGIDVSPGSANGKVIAELMAAGVVVLVK